MIDDILRGWVKADFAVDLAAAAPVGHGADQQAQLWRAHAADGATYAVKLSGGGTPAGLVVSAHLAAQQVPGIAAPLRTVDGGLWSVRNGRRLSMVPWIFADRALGATMEAAHWRAYGELLAAVHAARVSEELASLLPAGGGTHAAIVAAARAMAARLCVPGDLADPSTVELARVWAGVSDTVATLARQVELLGAELGGRPGAGVVCHGDPHLGNLLLEPDGRVWLIDWDDAVLAPRECDLMFVRGGVLAFAPVTGPQQDAFFAGYGPTEVDPERLAWFLTVRALDDLADWSRQALDGDADAADRKAALEIVRGLVSPVGLVTLARSALRDLGRLPNGG